MLKVVLKKEYQEYHNDQLWSLFYLTSFSMTFSIASVHNFADNKKLSSFTVRI